MKKIIFVMTVILSLCSSLFAQSLSGKRITVPKPTYLNGTKDDEWLPLFVQGQLTTDLQNFSELTVIDRLNQDKAKAEQKLSESASYSEKDQLEVGKLVAANYIVAINIIRKGNSFSIDAKINDAETNTTIGKAYSNSNCSAFALEDGSEINNMAYELLKGLGVAESKIASLKSKTNIEKQKAAIDANANIAKGLATELSQGSIVQSLAYYQKAASFNSEAANRIQTMTTNLSTGNIKGQVLNEIKQRQEWIQIWKDFQEYYDKNFLVVTYDDKVEQAGIDFEKNEVCLKVGVRYEINRECAEVYRTLLNTFAQIKQTTDWGKEAYPKGNRKTNYPTELQEYEYYASWYDGYINAKLFDGNKNLLAKGVFSRQGTNLNSWKRESRLLYDDKRLLSLSVWLARSQKGDTYWLESVGWASGTLFFLFSADKLPDNDNYILEIFPSLSEGGGKIGYVYSASEKPAETILTMVERTKIAEEKRKRLDKLGKVIETYRTDFHKYCEENKDMFKLAPEAVSGEIYKYITEIEIPTRSGKIADSMFAGCECLEKITIPSGVIEIGDYVFSGCKSLKSIILPDSVFKIGYGTFYLCSSLSSVTFPNDRKIYEIYKNIYEIPKKMFDGCSSLSDINLPKSIGKICERAFADCRSLSEINIPSGVGEIGKSAFNGCSSLESLTIPAGVERIGNSAFANCNSLKTVVVMPKVPPKVGKDDLVFYVYDGFPSDFTIYVPKESVKAYKKADGWKKYAKYIKPIE